MSEYTEEEIKQLASFRAMLLSMLVEGVELQGGTDEEILTKIDWFYKMQDTGAFHTQLIEESAGKFNALTFCNDTTTLLVGKLKDGKFEFFTTLGIQEILDQHEETTEDGNPQILIDIGSCLLFFVQALHANNIEYNLPTEISTETEMPDDDWAV